MAFAFDVAILVPDYEIDGVLWLRRHFEGGYLVRKLIVVEATRDEDAPAGWRIEYGFQSETSNAVNTVANTVLEAGVLKFAIPVESSAKCEAERPRAAPVRNASLGIAPPLRPLPDRPSPGSSVGTSTAPRREAGEQTRSGKGVSRLRYARRIRRLRP
jgi:hypothetical protein